MKSIIKTILLIISLNCYSQTQIVDLLDDDGSAVTGTYYRDTNNLLNPFEGTYIYTNGTTSFKIVLVKKVQQYNSRYYEDLIIGEYQYIENGVERVNTLSQINTVYNNQRVHNIDGNNIVNNDYRIWKCPQCGLDEKRLSAVIRDASTNRYAKITMRRTIESGQQVMKIKISHITGGSYNTNIGGPPPDFSLLQGEFTLIKQ